jgi:hypothetical protein
MQLVRFIDQGPWRLGASRTDQPHYRFRQTKSGNIGVEEMAGRSASAVRHMNLAALKMNKE